MNRFTKFVLILLGLAAAVAGGVAVVQVRPLAIEVAVPEMDVRIQVYGLGTVEARVASEVGFEVGNTLAELHADHGDRVEAGAVLARLHWSEQEARVAEAAAVVAQTEADVGRARSHVAEAAALLTQKQQVNQRQQHLVRQHIVSAEAAEGAQTEVDVAAAQRAVAENEVAVAEAALAKARARHRLEEVMLAHHTLAAPYAALVVERHGELGMVLMPGEPVFTLVDPETVWVLAYVDEEMAGGLRVGQPAEIRLRSLASKVFLGRVARIGIQSDRVSEERRVYIAFDAIPESIHLHEQAEVLITTARLERAVLVPETAVEQFDGTSGTVWTVEDGRLGRREARIDHRTLDGRLEVVGGVPDDARIVARPVAGLREGRAANPIEEGAAL